MKKIIIAIVAVFAMSTAANAQIQDLGLRLGGGNSFGGEISAMWGLGGTRLETDLGWDSYADHWSHIGLSCTYQWTGSIAGEFGWFAGLGANLGLYMGDAVDDAFGLAVNVQGGIEWNPGAIPFQFTLDVRPAWHLLGEYTGFGWGLALGIRYRF